MDFDDIDDALFLLLANQLVQEPQEPLRIRTGQPGHEYIAQLLDSGHPRRIHEVFRMQEATFYTLRDWLLANTKLKGDNIIYNQPIKGPGRRVSVEEKLGIFIYITSRGASNRDTSERFARSPNTISR